jgi:hypothetical protein
MAVFDPALVQQILDIAERSGKPDLQNNRHADDFWAALKALEWVFLGHTKRLPTGVGRISDVLFQILKYDVLGNCAVGG